MNCKTTQSLLSAYLDNELAGREMLDLKAHLQLCHICHQELKAIQCLKQMLEEAPVPEPSSDFEARLVANVLASTAPEQVAQKRLSILALGGFAAAAMVATLCVLNFVSASKPVAPTASHVDDVAYDMVISDRAYSAGYDRLGGRAPVILPSTYEKQ